MVLVLIRITSPKPMLWYSLESPHRGDSNEYPQHIAEAIQMSIHNVCFYEEITKIIPKLSSNTLLICSTD